ncbi:hypothetical protein [Nostoc commune]|uniref:hypothetical protein n=1 Tax=Nostoc commune TaxID=1178 RepID=UPI0018C571EB
MNIEQNPAYEYQVGGSLPVDAPSYVVRQADTDLYDALRTGKFCYVLNSRQMGKSSLRVQVMQRLKAEGIACAAIDLTGIGSQNITPDKWYIGVVRSLVSSFELSGKFNLRNWWREQDDLSSVQSIFGIPEVQIICSIFGSLVFFVCAFIFRDYLNSLKRKIKSKVVRFYNSRNELRESYKNRATWNNQLVYNLRYSPNKGRIIICWLIKTTFLLLILLWLIICIINWVINILALLGSTFIIIADLTIYPLKIIGIEQAAIGWLVLGSFIVGLWTKRSWFAADTPKLKTTHQKLPQLFFKLSETELNP